MIGGLENLKSDVLRFTVWRINGFRLRRFRFVGDGETDGGGDDADGGSCRGLLNNINTEGTRM